MKKPSRDPISFTVTVRLRLKTAQMDRINNLPDYPDIVNLSFFFYEINVKDPEIHRAVPRPARKRKKVTRGGRNHTTKGGFLGESRPSIIQGEAE